MNTQLKQPARKNNRKAIILAWSSLFLSVFAFVLFYLLWFLFIWPEAFGKEKVILMICQITLVLFLIAVLLSVLAFISIIKNRGSKRGLGIAIFSLIIAVIATIVNIWLVFPLAIRSGWTSYTNKNSDLPGKAVKAIAFDSRGRAWISTSTGMSAFDGKTWTNYTPQDIVPESGNTPPTISPLVVDSRDRVWVGWVGNLAVLDGKTWKIYSTPYANELEKTLNNRITALAVDPKGMVWLGLGDGSVSTFDGKTWNRYAEGDAGLESFHEVIAMAFDQQGRLWMGNDGGGVYVFDGETWETAQEAKSERNTVNIEYEIKDIAIDKKGQVWIATMEGLSVYDGESWIRYTPQNSSDILRALAVDASGRIWVGGPYGELAVFDSDGESIPYTPLSTDDGGYSMNVLSIDPRGRIWVGLDDGLRVSTLPSGWLYLVLCIINVYP